VKPARLEQAPPALAPLTHHEIVAIAAPFTRAGRLVDLAASDRAARRLAFKPQRVGELDEVLQLEPTGDAGWRLTRTLTDDSGLAARLLAEGDDPAELCARIATVAPASHFAQGAGWTIAWSQRLPPGGVPVPTQAELRLDGLTLQMSVSSVDRIAAEIVLAAPAGDITELPQDLLAVLGLPWARLDRTRAGWRSSLALRGRGSARGAEAQTQLQRAAVHLARTLAEPPPLFHQQRVAQRWAVTARRAVPLMVCVGVIAAALAVPLLNLAQDSVLRMLIFNAPPIMLGLFFALREMPRVEIPPLPRRITAARWRHPVNPNPEAR